MSDARARRAAGAARLTAGAVALGVLLAGCGAAPGPEPPSPSGPTSPAPVSPASPPPTGPASVPADGVALSSLGFRYAPPGFSVPRSAVFATRADQPNAVTVVLSAPPPAEVAGYLRTALPGAGFAVTGAAADGLTLTFAAPGWSGSFTATGGRSAILVRPA